MRTRALPPVKNGRIKRNSRKKDKVPKKSTKGGGGTVGKAAPGEVRKGREQFVEDFPWGLGIKVLLDLIQRGNGQGPDTSKQRSTASRLGGYIVLRSCEGE